MSTANSNKLDTSAVRHRARIRRAGFARAAAVRAEAVRPRSYLQQ